MKIKNILQPAVATAAALFVSACSPNIEKLTEECTELFEEAAEVLKDCNSPNDISGTVEDMNDLTEKMVKLRYKVMSNKNALAAEANATMTEDRDDELDEARDIARQKFADGVQHVEPYKSEVLNASIKAFKKASSF